MLNIFHISRVRKNKHFHSLRLLCHSVLFVSLYLQTVAISGSCSEIGTSSASFCFIFAFSNLTTAGFKPRISE